MILVILLTSCQVELHVLALCNSVILLLLLTSCQVELHVLALANVGIGEERVARKMIHKAMVQVCYLSITA